MFTSEGYEGFSARASALPPYGLSRAGAFSVMYVGIVAALLLLASLVSFTAKASDMPPLIVRVDKRPILWLQGYNNTVLYVTIGSKGCYEIVYASVNFSAPLPSINIQRVLKLGSRPIRIATDSLIDPRYVFIATANNDLVIWDLRENSTTLFSLHVPIKSIAYTDLGGPGILVLAGNKHLYAFVKGAVGWYEAGDVIGNMLEHQYEGISVLSLTPILNATTLVDYTGTSLVVVEVQRAYVPAARLAVRILYNGTPVKAEVYAYVAGEYTISVATSRDGSAVIPLPTLSDYVDLIIDINGTCRLARLNLTGSNTIRYGGLIEYTKPIEASNLTLITCPPKARARLLAYIVGGGFPPTFVKLKALQQNVSRSPFIVSAFTVGGRLHVWGFKRLESVNTNIMFDSVFSLTNYSYEGYYFYNIGDQRLIKAIPSPYGRLVALITSRGMLYIAGLHREEGYRLLWSYGFSGSASSALVGYKDGVYFILLTSQPHNILVAVAAENLQKIMLESWSRTRDTEAVLPFNAPLIASGQELAYVAFGGAEGLYVARGLTHLILGFKLTKELMESFLLKEKTIRVLNEDGGIINNSRYHYELLIGNETIYEEDGIAKGSVITVKCVDVGRILLELQPPPEMKEVYKPVRLVTACTRLPSKLIVPYRRYNVSVYLIDTYTNSPPERNVTLKLIDVTRNATKTVAVTKGTSMVKLRGLKPGTYLIRTEPSRLYRAAEARIVVPSKLNVTIKLERIPVYVSLFVTARVAPLVGEYISIKVYASNGRQIFSSVLKNVTPGEARAVGFYTPYRGYVDIVVSSVPLTGRAPFYKPVILRGKYIGDNGFSYKVVLEPYLYRLNIVVLGYNDSSLIPLNATIRIALPNGSTIERYAVNGTTNLLLWKGVYNVTVIPPTYTNTSFRLYSTNTSTVFVDGNTTVAFVLKRERVPSEILIVDKFASGGVLADEVEVYVDGVKTAILPAGKPREVVAPLAVNGSLVEVVSKHNVYSKLSIKLKPTNKTIVLKISRRAAPLRIIVKNEFGEPLPSAEVKVDGIDVAFSTALVTAGDGSVEALLPFKANYRICASAKGYYSSCETVLLAKPSLSVVLTLRPTLQTLLFKKYLTVIVGVVIAAAIIVALRVYLGKLAEKIAAEEEF